MHLSKIQINSFGRFKNFSVDFDEGLNIIYGVNEAGKSTLKWFIRGMLYGLKGGRVSLDGKFPPLRRFSPWSSDEIYGGYLEYFLADKKKFRIQRDFDKGMVSVFDAAFKDVTNDFIIDAKKNISIGSVHLGMDEECFARTAWIEQMHTRVGYDDSKELATRLINLTSSGNEDISFKKASEALQKAIMEKVGTERTTTRPLDLVCSEIKTLFERKQILDIKRDNMYNLMNEVFLLKEKIENLNERTQYSNHAKEFIDLLEEEYVCVRNVSILERLHEQIVFYEREAENIKNEFLQITNRKSNKELIHEKEVIETQIDDFNKELEVLEETQEDTKQGILPSYLKYLSLAVISILVLIGFAYDKRAFYAAPFIVMILSIVVFHDIRHRKRFRENLIVNEELEFKRDEAVKELSLINEELASIDNNIKYLDNRMLDIKRQIEALFQQAEDIAADNISDRSQLHSLLAKEKERLNTINDKKNTISKYINENKRSDEESISLKEFLNRETSINSIKTMSDRIESLMLKNKNSTRDCEIQLAKKEVMLDNLSFEDEQIEVESRLESLMDKKDDLEQKREALIIASEALDEAAESIRTGFAPMLQGYLKESAIHLTKNRYSDVRADDKLKLSAVVSDSNNVINVNNLSGGTVEQLYLSMRLALVKMFESSNETTPIIMDEVFSQYDDDRMYSGLKYLNDMSQSRQILFFTCKKREVEVARQINPKIKIINLV